MSEPKYKEGDSVYLAIPEYYTVVSVVLYDEGYMYRLRGLDNDFIHVEEYKLAEYEV